MNEALDKWIDAHPFLLPIARVEEIVGRAVALPGDAAPAVAASPPDAYREEHARGVPLLHSAAWQPDLASAVEALDRAVAAVADAPVANELREGTRQLREHFAAHPEQRLGALRWLVKGGDQQDAPTQPGLVRFLGWAALRAALEPALASYDRWRGDGQAWMRGYCPACGAQPAVSRLSPGEMMRQRTMICSCCASEWRYRRIGCPHCGNDVSDRISVLEVEGDPTLRIDACEECKGYVKTYAGDAARPVELADWTTLHLDLIAQEQGYTRLGASLVEI